MTETPRRRGRPKGSKLSDEHRAKMSAAAKRRWAKVRAAKEPKTIDIEALTDGLRRTEFFREHHYWMYEIPADRRTR